MPEQNELAKPVEVALELVRLLHSEVRALKVQVFALRDSVESGKPPLPFEDAQRQVLADRRESGHNFDDILPLIEENLERVRKLLPK